MKKVRGIWLPDSDTHFEAHLMKGPLYHGFGTYQLKKIEMALACVGLKSRGVAIDIGAHVGLWSRVLSHNFSRVIAFEPVPELIECFQANLKHRQNVELFELALGDVRSKVGVRFDAGNTGNSGINDDVLPNVAMFRLDDVLSKSIKIDFIKIDVEGYELPVLRGAEKTIFEHRPVMVIEQKPGNAERYGFGQFDAIKQLEIWGARRLWEKAGDFCYGW